MTTSRQHTKTWMTGLLCGTAIGLIAVSAAPAFAAEAPANDVEQVVVTGSRIVRNGYTAPTPVTVVGLEELRRSAPSSIPDGLNQLPQFSGSSSTSANSGGTATKPSDGNYLNLRNLGPIRTLILLDGQRLPPTSFDGTVDANIIPESLISRVDVVTGGASAAYGSDAVSGVVNFIFDTKFTGFKGGYSYGISRYDDNPGYKYNLAGGFKFNEGRGHVLLSYDHYDIPGIKDNFQRPLGKYIYGRVGAGTAANPFIDLPGVVFSTATYGTLIQGNGTTNAGNPLRNYQFLPGGAIAPFNLGTPTPTAGVQVGGDGIATIGRSLTGAQKTDQYFARADYDLTDNVSAFVQASFAKSFNSFVTVGSGTQVGDFRIFTSNAFLSDQVRNTLTAAGVTSFIGGRIEADQPFKLARDYNSATVIVAGLKGKLGDYNWRAGYSHGDTRLNVSHDGNFENSHWFAALDAVKDANGNIVCNVTLSPDPVVRARYAGCVPINIFGNGSPSKAAYDYVSKVSRYSVKQNMDIVNADFSGDAFTLPAGPMSFAVGAEYRRQKLNETSNTDPSKPIDLTGLRTNVQTFVLQYNSTNVGTAFGNQNVKEAFGEVAVPLLKDVTLVKSLDLNAAFRYTDYSTSGGVNTWKIGLSYVPIDDLRFRLTKSRDIRAPTLFELYAGQQASRSNVVDLHTNTNGNVISYTQGNPKLVPEKGDTLTAGVIWQPSFFRGFSASVDYYQIKINDAIGTLSNDQIQQQCEASGGTGITCAAIVRPLPFSDRSVANFPSSFAAIPFNQAKQTVEGVDYEVGYTLPIGKMIFDEATVDLRVIGTHLAHYLVQSQAGGVVIESNNSVNPGTSNNVKDRINFKAGYQDGPFRLDVQARYYGPAFRTQTVGVVYAVNDVKSITYVDVTVKYKFKVNNGGVEAFFTVNNLFDPTPPIMANGQPGQGYPTNQAVYDVIGRYYTTGLRFTF